MELLVRYPVVIDPVVIEYPDLSSYSAWLDWLSLTGRIGTEDQYRLECMVRGIVPLVGL